jgi:UPF0755 protein
VSDGAAESKPRARRRRRGPTRPRRKLSRRARLLGGAALAVFALAGVACFSSLTSARGGAGRAVQLAWRDGMSPGEGAAVLGGAGVVEHPLLFYGLLLVTKPFVTPAPGVHLLSDDLTPIEVLRRLVRLSSRARARVVVPEGYTRFQISARLEQLKVCPRSEFDRVVSDPAWLTQASIAGDSAEGYLAPATYDLLDDSDARTVADEMVATTRKRLAALSESHAAELANLVTRYGWGEREVITLASVVEREAARADELAIIASVFFNRLDDETFKPLRTLQSDPTAGYGCLVDPSIESCKGYSGRVTPAMLRDAKNPYNTYRHAGLPPSPIGNPGLRAIEAVLVPATTDYLFFVAQGEGRHAFSRTLSEHEAAIRKPREHEATP